MSSKNEKPLAKETSCPIQLPITKSGFDDIVSTLRHTILQKYNSDRESFLDKTLGNTAKERAQQSPKEKESDMKKVREADMCFAGTNPFKAIWLPTKGDIPKFPPRERAAAAKGPHPKEPTDGLMLYNFSLENPRLLSMTIDEMDSIDYMDAWLFRFALTRYFDFETAAARWLKWREIIRKYNLTLSWTDEIEKAISPGMMPSPLWADHIIDPSTELPQDPENRGEKFRSYRTPVFLGRARFQDFSKISMDLAKRSWFFNVSTLCSSDYYEQLHGHVMVMSGKDAGFSNMNREMGTFMSEAIQTCMPMKVQRMFFCNQGWFFNNIVSPLIGLLMSKKMLSKMITVTDDKYKPLIEEIGTERVGDETGGEIKLPDDSSYTLKFIKAIIASEKTVSNSSQ